LENFRGVFIKIPSSGDFQKFLNNFSIRKSVEWVHRTIAQVYGRTVHGSKKVIKWAPFIQRSMTRILWSEGVFYVLISAVESKMDDPIFMKLKGYHGFYFLPLADGQLKGLTGPGGGT
jgi:hypothetical protein